MRTSKDVPISSKFPEDPLNLAFSAMGKLSLAIILLVLLIDIDSSEGHGFLLDPRSRSAVMHPQHQTEYPCNNGPTNWTPQGNFCGGRGVQEGNGGQCSACGDNYAQPYPRDHDYGGIYANATTPTRVYLQGQMINVTVKVTAAHLGHFQFRLCTLLESDYKYDNLTACFADSDQYIVLADENNNTQFSGINSAKDYSYDLLLPEDVVCPRGCSLQWVYETGNSPGVFPEHFVNCADIRIVSCAQYLGDEYDLSWCAYGPTPELKWCDENAGGYDDTGDKNHGQESGSGNQGATESPGNGEQKPESNCTKVEEVGYGTPACISCTNAQSTVCNNSCCSEETIDVYLSTITGAPDMWCESHCTSIPPFCPSKWCYKIGAVHWVGVCPESGTKKSLNSQLETKTRSKSQSETEESLESQLEVKESLKSLLNKLEEEAKHLKEKKIKGTA